MGFLAYIPRYRVGDMIEFMKNERRDPADCDVSLGGKTAVITGATSGIGLATARLLASRGANLVCLNRNGEKSARLKEELEGAHGISVTTVIVDFSSLERTKACAGELLRLETPIDILILNSGVYHTRRVFTADGIETVFQVNHLSSFCLLYMLRERLKDESRARVIFVNSEGHRFALGGVQLDDLEWRRHRYTGLKSYGAAKTAQLLTMRGYCSYFEGSPVTVNAMHPGNVKSNIGENNGPLYRFLKRRLVLPSAREPEVSARALYYLAAEPALAGVSGTFFNLTTPEKPAPHAIDETLYGPAWNKSLELCGLA